MRSWISEPNFCQARCHSLRRQAAAVHKKRALIDNVTVKTSQTVCARLTELVPTIFSVWNADIICIMVLLYVCDADFLIGIATSAFAPTSCPWPTMSFTENGRTECLHRFVWVEPDLDYFNFFCHCTHRDELFQSASGAMNMITLLQRSCRNCLLKSPTLCHHTVACGDYQNRCTCCSVPCFQLNKRLQLQWYNPYRLHLKNITF
mmetsp:Transcript_119920/g.208228  ORF Transcript_119920/g.208228 Transcript_119920/m.208228 type:complete len:205 (+) Transcript_119920:255-869(+)